MGTDQHDVAETRRRSYWALHDFGSGHGLEVGPLSSPLVTRDLADVSYVDVMDRPRLVQHYADPAHHVDVDDIPEIDYFLVQDDGTAQSLAEAARAGAPFDWAVASHVIEHVPDVIGWLDDLAELVVDDGVLVLAIPDRRYTFDIHRPATTVGQMLEAHDHGDQRPTVRAVYDHFASVVDNPYKAVWRGVTPTYEHRIHGVDEALHHVQRTRDGEYVDCHVWLFTPHTFLHQMRELRLAGLSQWYVDALVPARTEEIEFQVRMRRVPRDHGDAAELAGELLPEGDRPEWVEHQGSWQLYERTARRAERLGRRTSRLEARLAARSDQLAALREQLQTQQRELKRARRKTARLVEQVSAPRAELGRGDTSLWRRGLRRATRRRGRPTR